MENKEKYDFTPSESELFRQMKKHLMCYASDMNAPKPFELLCDNIHNLNRLLVNIRRPWIVDCGMILKACAWYISFARPTEQETRKLIDTLDGYTTSAYQITEYKDLIDRMQLFLCGQEKELKRLFEYEKENERKLKERMKRMGEEGIAYSVTIGGGEINGVLYPQLEQLYEVMGRFIEREKAPFRCTIKGYENYGVCISKHVDLFADLDDFYVTYSLGTIGYDFDSMPAIQIQKVADSVSDFLKVFGENGDRKVRWDISDYPRESQPDIAFDVKEDNRLPLNRSVPWINKRIHKNEGKETEIEYRIYVNDIQTPKLSFGEFVAVYRKLGDFLHSRNNDQD